MDSSADFQNRLAYSCDTESSFHIWTSSSTSAEHAHNAVQAIIKYDIVAPVIEAASLSYQYPGAAR
jgi:hypothetical protein